MGQVGAEAAIGGVPATVWQLMQALLSKTRLPGGYACVLNGGLLLGADPGGKLFRTVHRDAQQHLCVLNSAVLRALAEKDSGSCGSIHIRFGWLGIRSVLPASSGTQKLWSVSAESKVKKVGVGFAGSLTGIWSSLAVTTPSFG